MHTNILTTANTNKLAKKKADNSKPVINEKLKIIVRELMIYKDNKRNIRLTKSFERPVQNKYSL